MVDRSGTKELTFAHFKHDLNWVWVENWKIDIAPTTDEKGWMYSDSLDGTFNKLASTGSCVRKRQWFRRCYRLF